jgi:two-component system LytT family sensor kinase
MPFTSELPYSEGGQIASWRSRGRSVALLLGVWTLFALLSVAQSAARATGPIAWTTLLADRFADWYSCALFTPAYFWLTRRYPIVGPRWRSGVLIHLGATQIVVALKYTLYVAVGVALGHKVLTGPLTAEIARVIVRNLIYENMAFWAVDAAVHALVLYRDVQEREARAERLRAELTQARLDALTGQLHPHFLFNALNSVSSLMHRDVAAADALLARLGDLLRRTLRASERPEVTLAEELTLLSDYLAIVGARFRDRLTVRVDAAPGTETALVPHFVLQPLVENALEHGIARRAGAGTLEVCARRLGENGETLVLSVADDGPGLSHDDVRPVPVEQETRDGRATARGVGLSNTRRRLTALHGHHYRLMLVDRPTGGLEVRVELPFRIGPEMPRASQFQDVAATPAAAFPGAAS